MAVEELLHAPPPEDVVDQAARDYDAPAPRLHLLAADLVLGQVLAQERESPDRLQVLPTEEHRLSHDARDVHEEVRRAHPAHDERVELEGFERAPETASPRAAERRRHEADAGTEEVGREVAKIAGIGLDVAVADEKDGMPRPSREGFQHV